MLEVLMSGACVALFIYSAVVVYRAGSDVDPEGPQGL
jgi:hypothetical protein